MQKEVKGKRRANSICEKQKSIDIKDINTIKPFHYRKMSFHPEPNHKGMLAYQSVTSKYDGITKLNGRKTTLSGFNIQLNNKNLTKCYIKPNFTNKLPVTKEETKELREINRLIKEINAKLLKTKNKKEIGVQTSGYNYTPKNPSTLTINSIFKDITINELFNIKPQLLQNMLKNADSDLKRFLISRIIHQYQYQLITEEILLELRDQGLEVEKYIYEAYDQLGIQQKDLEPSSDLLIMDTDGSESINAMKLDLDNLN